MNWMLAPRYLEPIRIEAFPKIVEVEMQAINCKEIEIVGSWVYVRKASHDTIDLPTALPFDGRASHTFSLEDVTRALQQFRSREVCQALLRPKQAAR